VRDEQVFRAVQKRGKENIGGLITGSRVKYLEGERQPHAQWVSLLLHFLGLGQMTLKGSLAMLQSH
jgi:hypothetical protein